MGYEALPFAVDLDKVRGVMGSNDTALLEKVKTSPLYATYADQMEDCDFDEILHDLIVGYKKPEDRIEKSKFFGLIKSKPSSGLQPQLGHAYGMALLVICDTLGIDLSKGAVVFKYVDGWEDANKLLKSKGITIDLDRMIKSQPLFDIPKYTDGPFISHYSKKEIEYLLSELNKMEIDEKKADENDDEFEERYYLLKKFRDGLQVCKDKHVEWVSFMH